MERIIKRYANRKLYDSKEGHYVTFDDVVQMIRKGEEVRCIDKKTKNDITAWVLIQILYYKEAESRFKSADLLTQVIRSPEGTFSGYISERLGEIN